MSKWRVWQSAFQGVSLREEGDDIEIDGCNRFDLDVTFPNYEAFWRLHVVPATNRPQNFHFRKYIDPVIAQMAMTSHGVFCDLVTAEENLVHVQNGRFGTRYGNCLASLKSGGDAMQKFDDLQRNCIQKELSNRLGCAIVVWTRSQWDTIWKPRYTRLAAYRNFLTHRSLPQVMLVGHPDGREVPHVPHEDHFSKYEPLPWNEQTESYRTTPSEWDTLDAVCARLHNATIAWLNDAYAEILKSLDALLTDDRYHDLWGWDTPTYGRQERRRNAACAGAQAPMSAGPHSSAPPGFYSLSARTG